MGADEIDHLQLVPELVETVLRKVIGIRTPRVADPCGHASRIPHQAERVREQQREGNVGHGNPEGQAREAEISPAQILLDQAESPQNLHDDVSPDEAKKRKDDFDVVIVNAPRQEDRRQPREIGEQNRRQAAEFKPLPGDKHRHDDDCVIPHPHVPGEFTQRPEGRGLMPRTGGAVAKQDVDFHFPESRPRPIGPKPAKPCEDERRKSCAQQYHPPDEVIPGNPESEAGMRGVERAPVENRGNRHKGDKSQRIVFHPKGRGEHDSRADRPEGR